MNTKSLSALFCSAMCMLLPAGEATAAPAVSGRVQAAIAGETIETGSLTVALRTPKGEAGSGLMVELLKNRGDMPPIHAKTNALGVAQFNGLPADSYLVLVYSPEGELLAWWMAKVSSGTNCTIVLAPAMP
jgi:hypothetical protein